jgi:hypothetical protein
MVKDKVYSNNIYTKYVLTKRIQDVASSVSQNIILKLYSSCNEKNVYVRCDVCLQAKGSNFKQVL